MIATTLSIILGFLLDLCVGDPYFLPHPVRFIGTVITAFERLFRKTFGKTARGEFAAGIMMNISVLLISTVIPIAILWVAELISPVIFVIVQGVMCYQILAIKSLKVESMKVYKKCKAQDLEQARTAVAMIVGRDTKALSLEGVIKAATETVAENTADGVVAPMLFMMLGGAPLGFFYKAVNTMDSMVGYKSEKYLYFGKFSAILDDVMNFIPARTSAILMIVVTMALKLDTKNAIKIYKRDRLNHASPNSAQTEAVCAGALNIMLAGDAYYFGKLYHKKTIGDPKKPIDCEDIVLANRLLYMTAILTLVLVVSVRMTAFFVL